MLSFYDFFPVAFTKVLGAFMSGNEDDIGMLYDANTNILQQRTFWDGTFLSDEVEFDAATLQPEGRKIRPGASSLLGVYSMIYGFIDTRVWYDNSFNQKARVFEVGGETGYSISHLDADDYIDCVSPVSGRRFAATYYGPERDSIGVQVIQRCRDLTDRYNMLDQALADFQDDPNMILPEGMSAGEAERELRRSRIDITSHEGIMSNMVHIIDIIGIGAL